MYRVFVPHIEADPETVDDQFAVFMEGKLKQPKPFSATIGTIAIGDRAEFSKPINTRCQYRNGKIYPRIQEINSSRGPLVYRLPKKIAQFGAAISTIAAHHHAAYPLLEPQKVRTRVTVDQMHVAAGKYHRGSGSANDRHTDGNFAQWTSIYTVADHDPTDVDGVEEPLPYQIQHFNGETMHSSPLVSEDCIRTFLRVIYYYDPPKV